MRKGTPIPRCPICDGRLKIEKYSCPACNIVFEGNLPGIDVPDWDVNEWHFVRTFITAEGNIQLTGKSLGISYPTVKQRLAEIIKKIDSKPSRKEKTNLLLERPDNLEDQNSKFVQQQLDLLAKGEIDEKTAEKNINRILKKRK